MRAALHFGGQTEGRLQVAGRLTLSAIAMIFVVHILDGLMLSYTMLWAYLTVGFLAWLVARGRGAGAALAVRHAAAGAWCAALLAGAYPSWLLRGI